MGIYRTHKNLFLSSKDQLIFVGALFLVISTTMTFSVAAPQKRSISQQDLSNEVEICRSDNACGWEVYDPNTRNLEYYVASSCKCNPEETCVQTDDDLVISAYVYKCRVIPIRKNKNKNRTTTSTSSSTVVSGTN